MIFFNISNRLRDRLLSLLLIPLLTLSFVFSIETYTSSKDIAKSSFDKSLSILTLTIMAQSDTLGGDSLSESVLELVNNSMGDIFFYHVSAPEGSYITGYTSPPTFNTSLDKKANFSNKPFLFDGYYQDQPVRAAFFRQYTDNEAYQGWINLTVWQYLDKQHELQNLLFSKSILRLGMLIILVCIILWLGIHNGLEPLAKLQRSIDKRSINDLSPINDAAPYEVRSLVDSMNKLFVRLKLAIDRREAFLGNASHQLKTPLARIHAKAEMAMRTKDAAKKSLYTNEVFHLTKHTSRLTNQMLTLFRAESEELLLKERVRIDLNDLAKRVANHYALDIVRNNRELIFEPNTEALYISGTPIMIEEAIGNLIENANAYSLEKKDITVKLLKEKDRAILRIIDGGPGISPELYEKAVRRFYRIPGSKSGGCGLGLTIVSEIASSFGAKLAFKHQPDGHFVAEIQFPISV